MKDSPLTKYPKPPFPEQSQPWPGLAGKMTPKPDHGETTYKGSGRLIGARDNSEGEGATMLPNMRSVPVLASAWIALLPLVSIAQTTPSHAPPNTPNIKRVEGTVARVDGNEFLLRVKGGTTETYQLSPAVQIVLARPGLMADLIPGKSAGCTAIYNDGAAELASECHVFTEGMHGFAQDHVAIQSSSTPTIEGTITDVRASSSADNGKGTHLLVRIGDQGSATAMKVSSLTEITVIKPGDASALKPGTKVRGFSEQAVDGTGVIQMLTIMAAGPGIHASSSGK